MTREERILLSRARAAMYRFLGGCYIMEVDKDQLALLKQVTFPEITGNSDADMDLREGYEMVGNYVASITPDDLDDLAADYSKVFLAAGDATGHAAFPYESVYVDKRHQVGGSTGMQMKALYLERGWEPDPNVYRTMYVNIGLMLEYMGILCDELTGAFEADDLTKAQSLLEEQRAFVKKHLINWAYSFTSDVVKFADRDFYKGIARITNGFLKKETDLLKEGGSAWDIA